MYSGGAANYVGAQQPPGTLIPSACLHDHPLAHGKGREGRGLRARYRLSLSGPGTRPHGLSDCKRCRASLCDLAPPHGSQRPSRSTRMRRDPCGPRRSGLQTRRGVSGAPTVLARAVRAACADHEQYAELGPRFGVALCAPPCFDVALDHSVPGCFTIKWSISLLAQSRKKPAYVLSPTSLPHD